MSAALVVCKWTPIHDDDDDDDHQGSAATASEYKRAENCHKSKIH